MDSTKKSTFDRPEADADAGLLLYKTGRSVKQFILWIAGLFAKPGKALFLILLFLIRNILWLALGAALGLAYDAFLLKKNGRHFSSEMTVKTNFNSSRSLYNTIDYMNAMLGNPEFSKFFGISPGEMQQLINFSAAPVKSEMITSELYRDQFTRPDRRNTFNQDTSWRKLISYTDFKEALTKYDYPYHTVSVTSSNPSLFSKLEKGIIDHISANKLLQEEKNRQIASNELEEKLITSSIQNLDTLRRAYNQRLISGRSSAEGNQITLMQTSPALTTPELDLYDKMLELVDELKNTSKKSVSERNIVEVYAPFNPVGQQLSFFRQSCLKHTKLGLLISFLILFSIAFYRCLAAYDTSVRLKKNSDTHKKAD